MGNLDKNYNAVIDISDRLDVGLDRNMFFNQNDKGTANAICKVVNNGKTVDLTDTTVFISVNKANGVKGFDQCKVVDGKNGIIDVRLSRDLLDFAGLTSFQISFKSGNDIVTSNTMYFVIKDAIIKDQDIKDLDGFSLLLALQKKTTDNLKLQSEMVERVNQLDLTLTNQQREWVSRENERIANENTRKANENERIDNENKRKAWKTQTESDFAKLKKTLEDTNKTYTQNENERIANENIRKANENERIDNEKKRQKNFEDTKNSVLNTAKTSKEEMARATKLATDDLNNKFSQKSTEITSLFQKETTKIETTFNATNKKLLDTNTSVTDAENQRVANENARKSSESTRVSNENQRIANEKSRESKKNDLVRQYEEELSKIRTFNNSNEFIRTMNSKADKTELEKYRKKTDKIDYADVTNKPELVTKDTFLNYVNSIPVVTHSKNGYMSKEDKIKLDTLETTDKILAKVDNLKANKSHTHTISEIKDLTTQLNTKADKTSLTGYTTKTEFESFKKELEKFDEVQDNILARLERILGNI